MSRAEYEQRGKTLVHEIQLLLEGSDCPVSAAALGLAAIAAQAVTKLVEGQEERAEEIAAEVAGAFSGAVRFLLKQDAQ
jgi:hypothetical protein